MLLYHCTVFRVRLSECEEPISTPRSDMVDDRYNVDSALISRSSSLKSLNRVKEDSDVSA